MLRKFATQALVLCTLLAAARFANAEAVQWRTDVTKARQEASQSGKLLLLHFYTDVCGPCKALDKTVFNQQTVGSALETNYIPVKINAFHAQELVKAYGLTRVPTDVIITPDGDVVKVMISPKTPMGYIGTMAEVASTHRAKTNRFAQVAAAAPSPSYLAQGSTNLPPAATTTPALTKPPTIQTPVVQQTITPTTPAPQPVVINNPAVTAAPAKVEPTQAAPAQVSTTNSPVGDRYAMAPTQPVAAQPAFNPQPVVQQQPVAQPAVIRTPVTQVAKAEPVSQTPTKPAPIAQPTVMAQTPVAQSVQASPAAQASPVQKPAVQASPTQKPVTPITPIVEPTEKISVAVDSNRVKQIKAALPAGSPELGFEGYCPVSMKEKWQWIDGDVRWGAIHEGRTYLFSTEAKRDQFLASPEKFSPVLSGVDPVIAVERNQSIPGKREYAVDYEGKFYFFASEQTLNKFWTNAAAYAKGTERVAATLKATGTQLR